MGTEDLLVGRVIAAKFAIESLIGSGSMGVVYRARHIALDKPVAVKVLHQAMAKDETFGARLRSEAKAASRLDHPNSVRVIDFGEEPDGLLYIAMELLDGIDLFRMLERDWPLPERRTVDLLCQTLSALAVAHDMGIVHRDLKPENIMLLTGRDDEGRPRDIVKVCDFGIAKIGGAQEGAQPSGARTLTAQGMIIGTPEYMSPEQCRGQPLDARSDLYSVGVILYQMLTGRVPFQAASAIDLVIKHISLEPAPPSTIRPEVSPKLEEVCLRALRKPPEERYSSAREMRADLRAIAGVDVTPDASGQLPAAKLVATNAETLLAALPIPSPATDGPIAANVVPRPATEPRRSLWARRRRLLRYAIPVAFVAAIAIGGRHKQLLETSSPPLAAASLLEATSAVAVRALPEPLPSSDVVQDRAPAPQPSIPSPRKPAIVVRSRAPARPASREAVETHPPADTEPEPATPPAPLALVSAAPATVPETVSIHVPPPAAPPPAPSARLDPSRGRVTWNVSAASGGATVGNVARALARAANAWQRCYWAGLAARSAAVEGTASMRLMCDEQGRVVDATFSGVDMTDVMACIRAASKGVTIPNADTGEAWASVALTFKVVE